MKTIFVVDDSDTNLVKVEEALEEKYQVLTMPSASKMFAFLKKIIPDLILLDIEMPEMNGFEALQILKSNRTYATIPIIFLTGHADVTSEARGFELGAVDFISKPFSALVLLNRIKTYLDIDDIIRERTAQLRQFQNSLVTVLADMVESRDRTTSGHIERTMAYIKILIKAMEEKGVYADELFGWDFDTTISSARLHDIGKITISDIILNKPGKLTNDEFERIKSHSTEGELIIDKMLEQTGEADFLVNAKLFAGFHHEHWDGSGYPHSLKGTEIPLQGRIMALVDVYDALASQRPYKEALTEDEVTDIIKEESGKYFDPKIVEVFLQVKDLFKEIAVSLR